MWVRSSLWVPMLFDFILMNLVPGLELAILFIFFILSINLLLKFGEGRILVFFIYLELAQVLLILYLLLPLIVRESIPFHSTISIFIIGVSGAETAILLVLFIAYFRGTGKTTFSFYKSKKPTTEKVTTRLTEINQHFNDWFSGILTAAGVTAKVVTPTVVQHIVVGTLITTGTVTIVFFGGFWCYYAVTGNYDTDFTAPYDYVCSVTPEERKLRNAAIDKTLETFSDKYLFWIWPPKK